MNVYEKIQKARELIDLKKSGRNNFSKYNYFTPEQVINHITSICSKVNLTYTYNLLVDEYGYYGELIIIDIEKPEDKVIFTKRTKVASMKGMNEVQEMGSMDTYTLRYLLQTTFAIAENNLDPDAHDTKKENNYKGKISKQPIVYDIGSYESKTMTEEAFNDFKMGLSSVKNINDLEKIKNAILMWTKDGYSMNAEQKKELWEIYKTKEKEF